MKQNLSFDFRGAAVLACALLLATACTQKNSQTQTASQNRILTAPTGATVSVEPEEGQWTMPAKNYASTRFSGLEDINTGNAASLKLAWSFSTGVVRGHEAAPIVANNTMYVVTPFLTGRGNSVAVIDEEQLTLITLIPVGKRAWGIALTPDGRKIYTANGLSKDVTVHRHNHKQGNRNRESGRWSVGYRALSCRSSKQEQYPLLLPLAPATLKYGINSFPFPVFPIP